MANPLLTTKLYLPPPRPNIVSRERLLQDLDAGLAQGRGLTLVSAPAGYGKSMLISEWIQRLKSRGESGPKVSWLSLDENDNAPIRFLTYLIAALQRLDAHSCQNTQSLLGGQGAPPVDVAMTSLINDITEIQQEDHAEANDADIFPRALILVLDDYHKVHSAYINDAIQFLLDYRPPGSTWF
jgi:LuxR family transcriptional regulator, maltose regulon positive regulatory protein